ncbi:hypothetical protein CLV35_3789 [Motilibacter peucedani]|uniref:Glyoxalase-like domain-containing protein n=1 Tax=Motilibacter peucedani TaxID=598650 RepID=A0A420XK44_9ACTN|nr:VOC family protein [Motilibacter peucedani]RKS67885.1 hypothetical protein CLV35_3789 [Motilibacter peucedani]
MGNARPAVVRLSALALDAADPPRAARFWAALLGREVVDEPTGPLLPGSDTQVGLRFVPSDSVKQGRDRVHLHVTSDSAEHQERLVRRVLELGGRHLDVGQLPTETHIVLADPEGDELCIIGPDSTFLAGCGPLGELACDGTRAVGVFWSRVLGWPLVWDQDEETAVQSPSGGTKVAWGGPPLQPKLGRNRQRFELAALGGELDAAVERLTALGAGVLRPLEHGILELADPDGNEFVLTATTSPSASAVRTSPCEAPRA